MDGFAVPPNTEINNVALIVPVHNDNSTENRGP